MGRPSPPRARMGGGPGCGNDSGEALGGTAGVGQALGTRPDEPQQQLPESETPALSRRLPLGHSGPPGSPKRCEEVFCPQETPQEDLRPLFLRTRRTVSLPLPAPPRPPATSGPMKSKRSLWLPGERASIPEDSSPPGQRDPGEGSVLLPTFSQSSVGARHECGVSGRGGASLP